MQKKTTYIIIAILVALLPLLLLIKTCNGNKDKNMESATPAPTEQTVPSTTPAESASSADGQSQGSASATSESATASDESATAASEQTETSSEQAVSEENVSDGSEGVAVIAGAEAAEEAAQTEKTAAAAQEETSQEEVAQSGQNENAGAEKSSSAAQTETTGSESEAVSESVSEAESDSESESEFEKTLSNHIITLGISPYCYQYYHNGNDGIEQRNSIYGFGGKLAYDYQFKNGFFIGAEGDFETYLIEDDPNFYDVMVLADIGYRFWLSEKSSLTAEIGGGVDFQFWDDMNETGAAAKVGLGFDYNITKHFLLGLACDCVMTFPEEKVFNLKVLPYITLKYWF